MLVGRQSEIATINRAVGEARSGRTACLVLAGEAGVGKTALLDDAVARAVGFRVLRTRGVEAEAEVPFAALVELLGPLASRIDELPGPQAAALQGVFALERTQQTEATAAAAATLALLSAAAEDAPLLVLVDDAHWLDAASGLAVALAARRLREARIAVLLAARAEEEPRFSLEGLARLAVEPLEPDAALELVASASPSLDEATAKRVVRAAAGNPLALLELPALARAGGGASILGEPLPPGEAARRLFGRRLKALEPESRLALLVAAGARSGDLRLLAVAWSSLGVATPAVETAETSGLVRIEEQRLEFRHPLVRSLVYGDAAPAERRRAHTALAEAMADDPRARDERIWHLALAAVGPNAEVADALAESAARLPTAAALERAARLTPDRILRARRLVAAAGAAQVAGEFEAAASLAIESVDETDDVIDCARAEHVIARAEAEQNRVQEAVERFVRAAESIENVAPVEAARILVDAIEPCAGAGEVARGVELAGRARDLARKGDAATRLRIESRYADALIFAGRNPEARRVALAAAEAAEQAALAGDRSLATLEAQLDLTEAFYGGGDVNRARPVAVRVVDEARRRGALELLRGALANLMTLEHLAGRVLPELAAAEEELEVARGLGGGGGSVVQALGHVAWGEALRGLESQCRDHVRECCERSSRGGRDPVVHPSLALLELSLGRPEDAAAWLEQSPRMRERYALVDAGWINPERPLLIEAYVRSGRRCDAQLELERFEGAVEVANPPHALALAARCRGLLAAAATFADEFERALRHHERDPRPFERARTLLCYGERLRREKRRLDARERIREALEAFVLLGATPWANRAEAELAATGERSRRRVAATRDDLTPQELTVTRLVAQGLTNREVAAQLFLSTNTIETHLRHVFQKLGVRSRTELAAKFTDFRDSIGAFPS